MILFKSGNFYISFDEDATVLNEIAPIDKIVAPSNANIVNLKWLIFLFFQLVIILASNVVLLPPKIKTNR